MKVYKNLHGISGPEPNLVYDDATEGGGLRILLDGFPPGTYLEINDVSEDTGLPRIDIRTSGSGRTQAIIVRPKVSNVLVIGTENL